MAGSISPTDTRPVFVQNPRLSDDDELTKQQGVPIAVIRPVPHDRIGASGGIQKKVSK
jgi:hypothetical protein